MLLLHYESSTVLVLIVMLSVKKNTRYIILSIVYSGVRHTITMKVFIFRVLLILIILLIVPSPF